MSVKRIAEQPRVTAPFFSEAAWTALDALGDVATPILSRTTCV